MPCSTTSRPVEHTHPDALTRSRARGTGVGIMVDTRDAKARAAAYLAARRKQAAIPAGGIRLMLLGIVGTFDTLAKHVERLVRSVHFLDLGVRHLCPFGSVGLASRSADFFDQRRVVGLGLARTGTEGISARFLLKRALLEVFDGTINLNPAMFRLLKDRYNGGRIVRVS